jgi:hypothetical protein
VVGKRYFWNADEFAPAKSRTSSPISGTLGATSLFGTKIYFVSDRTGHKECGPWTWTDRIAQINFKSIYHARCVARRIENCFY